MKFSVLVATSNRAHTIERCLDSILFHQNYENVEVILVDDCSADNTKEIVESYKDARIRYFRQDKRMERVMAFRRGLSEVTGDWVTHMGSDDELFPHHLCQLRLNINRLPEVKLFNYGWTAVNSHNGRTTSRPGVRFNGHAHFNSGLVAAGSFAWHRDLIPEIKLPEVYDCYAFATKSGIEGYHGDTRCMGNPWGEDYYMFYKMTRKNISCHIDLQGVVVHVR